MKANNNYANLTQTQRLELLSASLKASWAEELAKSKFAKRILEQKVDRDFYVSYMAQTFHYTAHNARNQALVGVRATGVSPRYTKFCFDHAEEETGHELMALHDIQAMGVKVTASDLPRALPETEVLVSYLYWISAFGNPLQRLGYSFWAEDAYSFIGPYLAKIRKDLELTNSQMTFFVAHADIDEAHAEEVKRTILENAQKPEDWEDMERVMKTSLKLTLAVADALI